jgi:hypothetical protein
MKEMGLLGNQATVSRTTGMNEIFYMTDVINNVRLAACTSWSPVYTRHTQSCS